MLSAKKELFTPSGGGYQISRSVRLRSSASAYFSRYVGTSNRKTFTFSGWVKKAVVGSSTGAVLFCSTDNSTSTGWLHFNLAGVGSADTLTFQDQLSNTVLVTTQLFRDPSAWYHIILAVDTTQATASNRAKLFVNGTQVTAFSTATYPAQNADTNFNRPTSFIHTIGTQLAGSRYFDGYLAEINFIDGQALTPSSFGETNAVTGVWQPKRYAGTYGTNGFYLNFSDNSGVTATTIGKDYSGNGNNWTPNNISVTAGVTYDSMLDVPTLYADGGNGRGNYATLNPLQKGSSLTVTDGNLNFSASGTASNVFATMPFTGGKFYFEVTFSTVTAASWGIATKDASITANIGAGGFANFWGFYCNPTANYVRSATNPWNNGTITTSSVGQIAVDATNPANVKMWIGVDNTWYNSSGGTTGNPATGSNATETLTNNVDFFPFFGAGNSSPAWSTNFGQRPFAYTPPTGFKALNTQNLPDATIKNGGLYMKPVLYTGTSPTAKSVTGVGFQPDFTWIKSRVTGYGHALFDAVRGTTKRLQSNATTAEATSATYLTSFDSDGFTVADDYGQNAPAEPYVSWNWNAGGTSTNITVGQYGTSPNVPSIASTVRANPTAGFSIVTYTGTGANATVGHGLNIAPKLIIARRRDNTVNWYCYHSALAAGNILLLNSTQTQTSVPTAFNSGTPTSTIFPLGADTTTNAGGGLQVAYCFAEVEGFSKIGTWQNNNSNDGRFIYLGFRPKFILLKSYDGAEQWFIQDSTRQTYNYGPGTSNYLVASSTVAEGTNSAANAAIDFLSNGFKIRSTNTAAGEISFGTRNYIYIAFAENPFKHSLAR